MPKTQAFTQDTYLDLPPPATLFSNPPDKVANVLDQYAQNGGTKDVPNAVGITLFGNKVPISPSTLRQGTNISLRIIGRFHLLQSVNASLEMGPLIDSKSSLFRSFIDRAECLTRPP